MDDGVRVGDREELAAQLARKGVTGPGVERVVEDATWGIVLEPGNGESRLGGRPVLAAGTPWPRTRDGRPLTHLATLALAELPDVEGREILPADGYLSFFADLETRTRCGSRSNPTTRSPTATP